jgi:hypothetical protein
VRFPVIEHHDLPGPQLGCQYLLDKGQEGGSVHKAFHHHGRHHPAQPQGPDHGDLSPAVHRLGTGGTPPARSTAMVPGHGLVAAGFVDEDQGCRIKLWDRLAEGGPLSLHLGALLFRGVKRFCCA